MQVLRGGNKVAKLVGRGVDTLLLNVYYIDADGKPEKRGYCQLAEVQKIWHTDCMETTITAPHYKGYRFPPEIISHAVWLYLRFSLSFRNVEELWHTEGLS